MTGLGNYSRDLVNTLCKQFPDNKYFLFDKNPTTLDLPGNTIAVVPVGNRMLWRTTGMLKDVRRFRLDVFHGLSNGLPWGRWPSSVKKVVTIHDVIFNVFPEQYSPIDRMIYTRKTTHAVKTADIIVATSQATVADLVRHYKVDPSKIKVVYQTCGVGHWQDYSRSAVEEFRRRRQLGENFILYVSSFETRKNHMALLKAFDMLNDRNATLVLAGRERETYAGCVKFVREKDLGKRIKFLTDISNAELPLLYRSAQSFVYPSMVEGFGIPLIEAACAGLPMATSDIPVFREIAPEGTLFFRDSDVANMAGVLNELMKKSTQSYAGHLAKFTPSHAASEMMQIYKDQ